MSSQARVAEELRWLKKWPHFEERPATIEEFLGEGYLGIHSRVRASLRRELSAIFGTEVCGDRISRVPLAMITGGIGIGKELRWDTPILTPQGWVPIHALALGDYVTGSDGKPTRVTGVYPQGRKTLYRVRFNDGAWVDAGAEHQWAVQTPKERHAGHDYRIVTTEELLAVGVRNRRGQRRFHTPVAGAVQYEALKSLPIAPYTLGAIIGDGGLTQGSVILSTTDEQILARVVDETGVTATHRAGCDYRLVTARGKPNPLLAALRSLDLMGKYSFEKRIPRSYLEASIHDRLQLLRGLMDTDGEMVESSNHAAFTTTSPGLADDVVELVRSLSGTTRLSLKQTNAVVAGVRKPGRLAYKVTIALADTNPFWVERKAAAWRPRSKYMPTRMIDSIECVGEDDAVCISVDAPDRLYVTKDFIVTHNTTVASIILPYMAHYVLCLKDPQAYFDLLPGSRIAFMQMSTSEKQALEVVFGDIKARIQYAQWFVNKYPFDPKFTNQLRFEKNIWIIPGDSAETTFEGYNILGGILDEADSHKVTLQQDYAELGYDTIRNRIDSRFGDRGFMLVIGQMKKGTGFAARKYAELKARTDAHVVRMAIWDSFGDDHYRCTETGPHPLAPDLAAGEICAQVHKFAYDVKRKQIVSDDLARLVAGENILWVPELYRREFTTNPEKALKDLAGIPPAVGDPFISLVHKIEEARDRWLARHSGVETPVDPEGRIEKWFKASDSLKRVAHLDLAYSAEGDALGFAMGHVREVVKIDGEYKPYIVIDLLWRVKAPAGGEIFLATARHFIYALRDDMKFRLKKVTMDGFQSTDTRQQLQKRRFESDYLSLDRDLLPYYDLRDAIYEDRIEIPKYMVRLSPGSTDLVEIAVKELAELMDAGRKIDHPPDGSKDVADTIAGVVHTLMGDRTYSRKVVSLDTHRQERVAVAAGGYARHPAYVGDSGVRAPLPPTWRPQ